MQSDSDIINVTKPFLPPLEELLPYIREIWDGRILTNNGPFLRQFEEELCDYLDVPYITVVNNGTTALEIAIKCLGLKGEIITTPYSFVATSQAILWNNIRPVFADIEPCTCTLDPCEIEKSVTRRTTGIIPVHVYGIPCKIDEINQLAGKYNLKIIYDAAHAFGVKVRGKSITCHGDLSILSFHATKILSTFEGGAIICNDGETKKKLDSYRDFGFNDRLDVRQQGINAKMNELQAAVGLLQLKYADVIINKRRQLYLLYKESLIDIPGLSFYQPSEDTEWNYSFFPVFLAKNLYSSSRDTIMGKLKNEGINCRRYFWPLISDMSLFKTCRVKSGSLNIAREKSEEVLCLPLYPGMNQEVINRVVNILRKNDLNVI